MILLYFYRFSIFISCFSKKYLYICGTLIITQDEEIHFHIVACGTLGVRGDSSRTTEGSGLGLSIARSFTELQNGIFEIQIDGDLFKVTIKLPITNKPVVKQTSPTNEFGTAREIK